MLAGFVAGVAMGLLALILFSAELVQHPTRIQELHLRFPKGTSLPLLMAGMALALQTTWGAIGIVVGAAYSGIESNAQDGLGSPAWGFTLFFLVLAVLGALTVIMINPALWRRSLLTASIFAATFGWMLPHLAEA